MLIDKCKYSWSEIDTLSIVWKTFADKYAGEFKTFVTKTSLRRFEIQIPFSHNQIKFVTTEYKPLNLCYTFKKILNDNFLIYNEDYTDKIMKFFGSKEFQIEDQTFDDKFFIETNNEVLVRQMLSAKVKDFLLGHEITNFKLDEINKEHQLSLTLITNELEISNLESALDIFKACILTIERKNNLL